MITSSTANVKKLITKQLRDNVLISQILRVARCRDTRLDTSRQLVTRETDEVEGEWRGVLSLHFVIEIERCLLKASDSVWAVVCVSHRCGSFVVSLVLEDCWEACELQTNLGYTRAQPWLSSVLPLHCPLTRHRTFQCQRKTTLPCVLTRCYSLVVEHPLEGVEF